MWSTSWYKPAFKSYNQKISIFSILKERMHHHPHSALNWYLLSACFCAQTVHILSVFRREDRRRRFFPVDALWTLSLAMTESSPSRMPLGSTSSLCFLAPILLFLVDSNLDPVVSVLRSSTRALFSFCTCILAVYSYQFWWYAENPYREDGYNQARLLVYATNDTTFMVCASFCVLQLLLERVFPISDERQGGRGRGEMLRRLGNVACVTFPFFLPQTLHMEAFSWVVGACLVVFSIGVLLLRTETAANKVLYVLCMSLSAIVTALYVPLVSAPAASCRLTALVSLFHACVAVMFTLVHYSSSCGCARLRRSVSTHAFLFLLSLVTPVLAFLPLFSNEPTSLPASVPGAPLPHTGIVDLHLPLNSTVQECRDAWNDPDNSIGQLTLLYRTFDHPTLPGSCVAIEFGPTVDFSSLEWQLHHTTHCFEPLSSPLDGCTHEACLYRVRTASLVCVLVLFAFRLFRVRASKPRRAEGEAEVEREQQGGEHDVEPGGR